MRQHETKFVPLPPAARQPQGLYRLRKPQAPTGVSLLGPDEEPELDAQFAATSRGTCSADTPRASVATLMLAVAAIERRLSGLPQGRPQCRKKLLGLRRALRKELQLMQGLMCTLFNPSSPSVIRSG